jgi:Alpha-L-fucosidase
MHVGFYYSLMDWHHPDGANCANDEAARRRFVDYTHGLIRELLANYGKVDVLWYDVACPLDAAASSPSSSCLPRRAAGLPRISRDAALDEARFACEFRGLPQF